MCQHFAGHIIQIIDLSAAFVYFIHFRYCVCDIYILLLYLSLYHSGRLKFCIIFGPKRDDMTREWRKLHNEELNDLYCSHSIVRVIKPRRMRWAGHVARTGERLYRVLVGEPQGKRPLGRPRRR
jgi:hypothetical protein